MTSASAIAAEISELVPRVKRGSLAVFGDIFGGRIDNIHTVTRMIAAATAMPSQPSSSGGQP